MIQKRENDLVLATFGRGFYVLDDYTPLRSVSEEKLKEDAVVFPVKPALRYIQRSRLGGRNGHGAQGKMFFATPNPPFGATFTYFLKDKIETRKEKRKKAEKKGSDHYPTIDELRAEDEELTPSVYLVVKDDTGAVVQRVKGSRDKGLHRVSWNLRYPSSQPARIPHGEKKELEPWSWVPIGPLALPGTFTVTLEKEVDGKVTTLVDATPFDVIPLELASFPAKDREAVMAFRRKVAHLNRAVQGASRVVSETKSRLKYLRQALIDTPAADMSIMGELQALQQKLDSIDTKLNGDHTLAKHQEPVPTSIRSRVVGILSDQWGVTSAPTQTQIDGYGYAADEFTGVLADLTKLVRDDIPAVEAKLEAAGAPWTPGRLPTWVKE